ncbi:MAG: aminoacyl-tRNA hydrolase [Planctomycetota bacterium]|nr:MAG: aminoacyl-tRNA hydrolase [Planctomycetota bacterium]
MKLIVGLGNPGPRYAGTRHNVGYDVVDRVARRWNIDLGSEKFHGWFGKGTIADKPVVLLKPTTWMNRSGQAVVAAGRFYKLSLEDLLVISDDLALPLGRLRLRTSGSAGGHKGLQDILDRLGDDRWCRLRVGIGEAVGDPVRYVLERFTEDEEAVMEPARQRAAEAVACWVEHGPQKTMNRYNGDPPEVRRVEDD